jgi:hypothetical protein
MKKLFLLLLAGSFAFAFTGCETTGDPNSGGIFWSERKAQGRLNQRQHTLNSIESDTARVERSNDHLESAAERKRRLLEE